MPGTEGEIVADPNAPKGGKRSAWMAHVKETMRAHKGWPLSKALKAAAKSYNKKTKKAKRGGGLLETASPLGATGGRRRSRKSRGSRKH